MKNIRLIFSIVLFSISLIGCSLSEIYNTSKTIYIANKEIVIDNFDSLDENTKSKLIKLDESAKVIDKDFNNLKVLLKTKDEINDLINKEVDLSKKNME